MRKYFKGSREKVFGTKIKIALENIIDRKVFRDFLNILTCGNKSKRILCVYQWSPKI